MKKALRWAKIFLVALVLATLVLGFYIRPKGLLTLKGEILGPAFWDLSLLNRLEFGNDFGMIYDSCYMQPSIKWKIPLRLGEVEGIIVTQIFDCGMNLKNFQDKATSQGEFFGSNLDMFFKTISEARGMTFLILETEHGDPILVWERRGLCLVQKWINPVFLEEIRKLRTRSNLFV